MNIIENYSDEEIQNVREYIEMTLDEYGIDKTIEILQNAKNMQQYLETYDNDRKNENSEYVVSNEEKDNVFLNAFLKALLKPKTEKLDDEVEENLRIQTKELKKILDIVINDDYLQNKIADEIEDVFYDEDDILSRMNSTKSIISTIKTLQNPETDMEKMSIIYEALNNKIKELNFSDFVIVYRSVGTRSFFENKYFKDTILEKIKSMTNEEFLILLVTTQDGMDGQIKEIQDAKEEKTEQCENDFITEVNDSFNFYSSPKTNINFKTRDFAKELSDELSKDIKTEKKFEDYSNLSQLDFVRFVLMNKYSSFDNELFESDITDKKLGTLPKEYLAIIIQKYYDEYLEYLRYLKDDNNTYYPNYIKNFGKYTKFFQIAKNEGIITQDYKKLYDEEKVKKLIDSIEAVNIKNYLNIEEINFKYYIGPDDNDIDDRSCEEILLDRFKQADNNVNKTLAAYMFIDKVHTLSDKEILKEANRNNQKYKTLEESDTQYKYKNYLINYFKKRIINMPSIYSNFFQFNEGGILNDIMELKAIENSRNNIIIKGDDRT